MRLTALIAAVALLLAACGGGETADGDKIFPYDYQIDDFPNGLRLVSVDSGYPNLVALYVVVRVGSRNEVEPGRSGFAHLFEHMMFRGTEKFPSDEWERIMQGAGAATNAYTSDDRTVYHAVFAKEDLEPILELEADRFQNLKYSEELFRTETRAVLGEYNKNFSDPFRKLDEQLRHHAFAEHTYRHSTMGYIEDVENMPEMYDYGLKFFDRYYRPEYTVINVVGDIDFARTKALVEKYWGPWARGKYVAEVPAEPKQTEAKRIDIPFQAPTLPMLSVSYHAPAYSDEVIDSAVLDLISFYAFDQSSDLFKKLVLEEQKVQSLFPYYADHRDPFLFSVIARVKEEQDVGYVEEQVLSTVEKLKNELMPAEKLEAVKSHLRYSFALGMDSTDSMASTLAHFLSLEPTPETVNKRYALYQKVTPQDVQAVAKKVFVETGRTIATLKHEPGAAETGGSR